MTFFFGVPERVFAYDAFLSRMGGITVVDYFLLYGW